LGARPLPPLTLQGGQVGEVVAAGEHVARVDRLPEVDDGVVPFGGEGERINRAACSADGTPGSAARTSGSGRAGGTPARPPARRSPGAVESTPRPASRTWGSEPSFPAAPSQYPITADAERTRPARSLGAWTLRQRAARSAASLPLHGSMSMPLRSTGPERAVSHVQVLFCGHPSPPSRSPIAARRR